MTYKGSWQRPYDKEQFNKAFDKIFGTKNENRKDDTRKNRDNQDGINGSPQDSTDVRSKAQ